MADGGGTWTIPHEPEGYLRCAAFGQSDGALALHAIRWVGESEQWVAFPIGEDGAPGEAEVLSSRPAIIALAREASPRPSDDADAPDRVAVDGWRARVERASGRSRVVVVTPAGLEVEVFDAVGTAAAPTLAPTAGGAWVAFHHNVREESGEPDLIKWIDVRFVDPRGEVLAPKAPMRDRDRDREGEEQGFEFPSLSVGEDGALALFGRGSHVFWRQDLSAAGWSPRRPLGEAGWGCRGRWVATAAFDAAHILTARREKAGLVLALEPGPEGGAPELERAEVRPRSAPYRDSPRRAAGPDPMADEGRLTLFGDIHQHSAHSDGCGSADEPYLRARHLYGDDFCALTDHESFIGKRIGPGEWAYLQAVAEAHDEPGEFATLIAYEWTGRMYPGPGHKVVYLPGPGHRIVSRDDVPEGADLVREVKALGGFAVPHHVGWTGADEGAHDPEGQPVWEICSCHGCYLHAEHPLGGRGQLGDQMVEAVMRRGLRFGFIACSDGHGLLWHHGVGRKRDPFRCGLTAVQARARTREAILEAIRDRRCYATSGARIYLDLRAGPDASPMGSELSVGGPCWLVALASGSAPIESLSLMGPEGVVASVAGEGASARVEAQVDFAGAGGWVYARVVQADGEMAWSSPIFFDPA